ncbi:hypothetical protein GCM10008959_32540 [Deinococcus seoulensis]|uniref:Uncharacterized protein n=1 Tax=Deinococcus seoulensis TaxID=1837379 RepID=A0ABQ2RX00_9DEIO|nr:hypothetical protein [Deinococcus seoulensis]GGR67951.1 hypothetical protein GCM10008959_32540 [Deinococcus seoulensis]
MTPVFPAPSEEETAVQRQLTDRKDIERQTAAERLALQAAPAAAVSGGHLQGKDLPSGADRTGTPGGVKAANATTGHGITPATANAGQTAATTTEQVPAARGATLAALHSALRPLPAQDLIDELPSRQHWLDIPADRVREMHDEYRTKFGSKRFRGDLIDALDREARKLAAPTAPATTNVGDLVRARLKGTR